LSDQCGRASLHLIDKALNGSGIECGLEHAIGHTVNDDFRRLLDAPSRVEQTNDGRFSSFGLDLSGDTNPLHPAKAHAEQHNLWSMLTDQSYSFFDLGHRMYGEAFAKRVDEREP
jgi:hypothetical protein